MFWTEPQLLKSVISFQRTAHKFAFRSLSTASEGNILLLCEQPTAHIQCEDLDPI